VIPGQVRVLERREPATTVEHCVCGTGGSRESHRQRVEHLRARFYALCNLRDCQSTVDMLMQARLQVEHCMALDKSRKQRSRAPA
jgi:hypothetical protein